MHSYLYSNTASKTIRTIRGIQNGAILRHECYAYDVKDDIAWKTIEGHGMMVRECSRRKRKRNIILFLKLDLLDRERRTHFFRIRNRNKGQDFLRRKRRQGFE